MKDKQLPVNLEGSFDSIYGNFGYRFAALLLDGIILAPMTIGFLFYNSLNLNNVYFGILVSNVINIFYHIYIPTRFGATPGKLALGLHILKMNGDAINFSDAFRRYLPNLLLGLIAIINTLFAVSKADAKVYNDLSWMKQSEYLQSLNSYMFSIQMICINAFFFTSFIIFMLNERKRSISDLSGDTAVVKKYYLKQIKEVMKK
jgi:uncharacterized RDD family membrane protein YckC